MCEGLGGGLVKRDAFDEVGRVGIDLEEERCLLTGAGSNDGDGRLGPRGEGEPFEVDAAALGDGVAEEGDHGLCWEDVAKELATDVPIDLVDGGWLSTRSARWSSTQRS